METSASRSSSFPNGICFHICACLKRCETELIIKINDLKHKPTQVTKAKVTQHCAHPQTPVHKSRLIYHVRELGGKLSPKSLHLWCRKKSWYGILQASSQEAALRRLQQSPAVPLPGWTKADETSGEVHIHCAQVQRRRHLAIPAPGCLIKCDRMLLRVPVEQLQEMQDCLAFEQLTF